ncbi:MAG: SDR family oxidoreductase [Verrucomicrobiota bacterium]
MGVNHVKAWIIGCGYTGSRVGELLARSGVEVYGMRRSADAEDELKRKGINLIRADILEYGWKERFDWVINTISSSGGTVSDYQRVYLEGARRILEGLRENPPERFLFTSSTSVYGQTDGAWVNEESETNPQAETSKVLVETESEISKAGQWLRNIIVRLGGIYGPGRGYAFKQFVAGNAVMRGDGGNYMNLIHVEDAAAAIVHLLKHPESNGVYNIVDDEPVTQRDFYNYLSHRMNLPVPERAAVVEKKRGVTNKRVANQRVKKTGYRFKYSTFREGYEPEIRAMSGSSL